MGNFHAELHNELLPLYIDVKNAIILAETFNENRQMYIAPINELRVALDHIFKALEHESVAEIECKHQLEKAKNHITRAGYDALELLAGNLGASAIQKLHSYSTDTLTQVFPRYFTEIKPQITKIQVNIATLRTNTKKDTNKSFREYLTEVEKLIEINSVIDITIPSLQEYARKKRREIALKSLGGIIVAIVIAWATWYFGFN